MTDNGLPVAPIVRATPADVVKWVALIPPIHKMNMLGEFLRLHAPPTVVMAGGKTPVPLTQKEEKGVDLDLGNFTVPLAHTRNTWVPIMTALIRLGHASVLYRELLQGATGQWASQVVLSPVWVGCPDFLANATGGMIYDTAGVLVSNVLPSNDEDYTTRAPCLTDNYNDPYPTYIQSFVDVVGDHFEKLSRRNACALLVNLLDFSSTT